MTKVICIGECMVELRPNGEGGYGLAFAGDAFNAAVYLKRSAPEFDVHFLTTTGIDALSLAMRAAWAAEGIVGDLAFIAPDAIPGLYLISLDRFGERSFTYWRSASAARRWVSALRQEGGSARLKNADLIYLSGISLAILQDFERTEALKMLADVQLAGAKIAFDPNYRPALWSSVTHAQTQLRAAMDLADIVLPSQDDLNALGLAPSAQSECVTTHGARGCTIVTPTMNKFIAAPRVAQEQIVDTAGAGDAFSGTYLAARLKGADPVASAQAALDVAARVVTAPGAVAPHKVSHPA